MNTKEMVMKVTEKTFRVIKKVYDSQKETNHGKGKSFSKVGSRIIFPQKRSGENRISEQELKFIFVEQLYKYAYKHKIDIHYSVETPTNNPYKFPKNGEHKVDPDGKSASTDLTIHDSKFNRICLIEFKALNPNEHGYKKDFCKLFEEPDHNSCLRFFIQIIDSYDNGTLKSLKKKVYEYMEKKNLSKEKYDKRVHYICYYLKGPDEKHGYPAIITNVRPSEFKKYKVFEKEKIEYIGF